MKPSDFSAPTGQVLKSLGGTWAFVPHALPPEIKWDAALAGALERAGRRLGELNGWGPRLVDPSLLIRPFINREAVLSSRIEGTQTNSTDLAVFQLVEQQQGATSAPSDTREVNNYRLALTHGLKSDLPVSLRLIREMHEILMRNGRRDASVIPGEFRTAQNWIGVDGCRVEDAAFVPPPPEHLQASLNSLEQFINDPSELPPLIRVALAHYQFEAIHPFVDGNGRLGRILIVLLLTRWQLLSHPLLYLSAYFETRRDEYNRRMREVSLAGGWHEWLLFFLAGVELEARDAARRAAHVLALRDDLRKKFPKGSVRLHRLLDHLFAIPATTIPYAARDLGVTFHAASDIIDKFVAAGVLSRVGRLEGHGTAAWYFANAIRNSIDEPLPEPPTG